MEFIIACLAQAFLFRNSERNSVPPAERNYEKPPGAFEDDNEIPHARLAHFPAQIGHWRISLSVTNHNR